MTAQIRAAGEADMPAVNAIYNHYVLHSTCTFHNEPLSEAERLAWFAKLSPRHFVLVAEDGEDVIGWASLVAHKDRPGYNITAESSVYLHHDRLGQGLGKRLMSELIARARSNGFHSIIAGACTEQEASIRLHESLGFRQVAYYREIGEKFGRLLDTVFFQLMLEPENPGT